MEIKDYSVKINGKNISWSTNNNIETYGKVRKIVTGQGEDYTTGSLLDYPYVKKIMKWVQ